MPQEVVIIQVVMVVMVVMVMVWLMCACERWGI